MFKRNASQKIDAAVSRGVNFEVTIADIAKQNERRAWMVAFAAIGMSLILAGTCFYMLPLKEKIPYLVLADAYTGTSSMSRLTDDVINRRITANEAINRSNVAHFVLARESYDLALTNLRDWPTVLTMSAYDVAQAYMNLHATNNEASPFKVYGKFQALRVKLLSIVLIGGEHGRTPKGATVRFQRTVYDKNNGATRPLDSKIATMEFTYKPNLRMDDRNRVENPLGFQVTAYRVDNDYGSPPAPEWTTSPAVRALPGDGAGPASHDRGTPASETGQDSSPHTGPTDPTPKSGSATHGGRIQ